MPHIDPYEGIVDYDYLMYEQDRQLQELAEEQHQSEVEVPDVE